MADSRTKMASRVAQRHLHPKTAMTRTAGEVRFIKDRGGDEKNWAYADTGPSERDMNVEFKFSPSKLKPLARCLRSALMALGHTQSAYGDFAKLKSALISPDGNLGGKGYIQQIRDMRRQFMNCSEALSSLTDTLYDEINAPHWAMDNPTVDRQREDVKEIMDDVEEIRDNPEAAAEESDVEQFGKQARRKTAAGSGDVNKRYLDSLRPAKKAVILEHIAKHYGTTAEEIEGEMALPDAEDLFEYVGDRSMAREIYNDFKSQRLMASKTARTPLRLSPSRVADRANGSLK